MTFRTRPWYDRDPKIFYESSEQLNEAPHIPTTRWTYTAPEDKITFVELLSVQLHRRSAATVLDLAYNHIYYQPKGKGAEILLKAILISNTIGWADRSAIGNAFILQGKDRIWAVTRDFSTGGTIAYHSAYKLTQVDIEEEIDVQQILERPDPVM